MYFSSIAGSATGGMNTYALCKLHDRPDYMSKCVRLLNSEWPRSEGARLWSLGQSRNSLPMSLILVDDRDGRLVGHVKIGRDMNDAIFLESLVVDLQDRGQGLGKFLMTRCEERVKEMGFKHINLTTTDKVAFYQKLGYTVVDDIVAPAKWVISQPSYSARQAPLPPPPPHTPGRPCAKRKTWMRKILH